MIYMTILSVLFTLVLLHLERGHRAERKELCDRLMCKDATEYGRLREKKGQRAQPPYVVSAKKWRDTQGRDRL